jgi:hypothetical protein
MPNTWPARFPVYSSNSVPNGTTVIVNNTFVSRETS